MQQESSQPCRTTQKNAWKSGPFVVAIAVNIVLTCMFKPYKDGQFFEYGYGHGEEIQCAWLDTWAFYAQMLASFGASCAAAFLWTRAGASQHAMSAVGYAIMNWSQSVLMTLMVAAKPWGCRYGVLARNPENTISMESGRLCWVFLNPLNLIFFLRSAFYFAALVWMQWLLERRIHALEKTSGRQYGGQCLRRLLQLQAFCLLIASLMIGPALALLLSGQWTLISIFLCAAFGLGACFMAANVIASALAIWALFRSVRGLRDALQPQMLQHTPCDVKGSLKGALRYNRAQAIAVALSLVLSVLLSPAVFWQVHTTFSWHQRLVPYPQDHLIPVLVSVSVQVLDVLGNALAVVLLSGTHRVTESGTARPWPSNSRACFLRASSDRRETWRKKVEELSLRGLTLNSLLKFYEEDLRQVDGWQYVPDVHRTKDVVRRVIIPLTAVEGSSYASSVYNRDKAQRAQIMVTHNWGNRFRDLLAAMVANALQECSFQMAAQMLEEDPQLLRSILGRRLEDVYWVCAFSVNQHISICHTNPYDWDPVSKWLHPTCNCSMVNVHDPDGRAAESEINKFDDMMKHLAATGRCKHLIAVDESMDLFNRAWCIAEIAEGKRLRMHQSLKLVSKKVLLQRQRTLQRIDIARMKCANGNDLQMILTKIQKYVSIPCFNEQLQSLIFDEGSGLLKTWQTSDNLERMGEAGRLLRWSLADGGTGKVWRFWRTEQLEVTEVPPPRGISIILSI